MTFGWAYVLLALVVVQRLAEVAYDRRNSRALMARGAREFGANHYPVMVVLHTAWLAAMAVLTAPNPPIRPWWLALLALCQAGRVWCVASLGPYWTTRIVVLEGSEPVTRGPYRYLRHPNYLIVAFEVPALPMALSLPWVAAVFGVLNLALLAHRIRVEDAARAPLAHNSGTAA
ncbi:MAG TPA: isoprenylcysteine carboxylmethyltransferase family protein [Bauldia sp.]|nr:isoprenylcysteine carboxylmethyltransferase family protein [Bauldia sp.]